MSEAAREKWDARYGADGYEPSEEPVPFLRERVGDLGSGSALCLAAGTGRNAVFLAERGFAVTAVDISPRGLAWACALAQRRGVEIEIVAADLLSYDLGTAAYDLITDFYFYEPDLFPAIGRAIKPGGRFVFQTFSVAQAEMSGGPSNRAFMVEQGDLLAAFTDWRVRYFEDTVVEDQAVVRLIAEKR